MDTTDSITQTVASLATAYAQVETARAIQPVGNVPASANVTSKAGTGASLLSNPWAIGAVIAGVLLVGGIALHHSRA